MEATIEMLLRLALSHWIDSMSGDDLGPLQTTLRLTVIPFLAYFDPTLHDMLWSCDFIMDEAGDDSYSFCLPWILTWFSHDPAIPLDAVKRLIRGRVDHIAAPKTDHDDDARNGRPQ